MSLKIGDRVMRRFGRASDLRLEIGTVLEVWWTDGYEHGVVAWDGSMVEDGYGLTTKQWAELELVPDLATPEQIQAFLEDD